MDILDSVAKVTEHKDKDSLEISLVTTLAELYQPTSIRLLKITNTQTNAEALVSMAYHSDSKTVDTSTLEIIPIDQDDSLQLCLTHTEPVIDTDYHHQFTRAIYPIFNHQNSVIGFIELVTSSFNEAQNKLVTAFMKIYRNYLRIIDESNHDTLTGLLNRKTFDSNFYKILLETKAIEEKSHKRRKIEETNYYWLAIADIDNFKHVNDTYGHLFGDEVLILLTQVMGSTFRNSDMLYRFGGEEFVIILSPTEAFGAKCAFEQFRKAVESYKFPQIEKITISLGFTQIKPMNTPTSTIDKADAALYYAKEHGRNSTYEYEQLVKNGKLAPTTINTTDVELFDH
ncbi:MAG: GGDEF domain-containing protein [Gammaproteobacteria bacterium]|nr:GGDEF domain-containing protein [Gammaproteobacteria bacterium]